MLLEVYADLLAPASYLALRRLRPVLDGFDDQLRPEVVWRPLLLDRTAPSPSTELGDPPDPVLDGQLQQTDPGLDAGIRRLELRQQAVDEGIGPPFGARWRASSWAAHKLLAAAAGPATDTQQAVLEELLHAHFVAAEDINGLPVLRRVAERFGLPAPAELSGTDAALAFLQAGVDPEEPAERAAREGQLFGEAIGVAVAPTFVVADKIIHSGVDAPAALADRIAEAVDRGPEPVADEVRRFRHARTLLEQRNPLGSLYLLKPLRPEYDGQRSLEILSARALAASASLEPAREKLDRLLERYPDDAYLHLLMGKTLKRMGDDRSARHLALATAMDPQYLDF